MDFKFLKVESHGRVAIVTVNKPEVLNILDTPTVLELDECFTALGRDQDVDVIIITGAGEKAFIAGGDIKEMSVKNPVGGREYGRKGQRMCLAIEDCPKPVIAAVNGYALGGGTELAMSCDMILASDKAVFGQPEVKLGITPGFAGTQRMPRMVGRGRGKEYLFSGRNIKAEEALRIGLANRVYPHDKLMEEAMKLAQQISSNGQIAVRSCKELINFAKDNPQELGLAKEADAFGNCFATEDQKEGMEAFLGKRPAKFRGK
jgi:enoyl-CoA hydratase